MTKITNHGGYKKKDPQGLGYVRNNKVLVYNDGKATHEINSHFAAPTLRDAEMGKLERSTRLEQVDIDELLKNMQEALPNEVDKLAQFYAWVAPRIGRMKIYQTRVFEGCLAGNCYNSSSISPNYYIVINRVIVYFEDGKDEYQNYRGRPFNNGVCFHVFAVVTSKDKYIMNSSDTQANTMSELYVKPVCAYNKITRNYLTTAWGSYGWYVCKNGITSNDQGSPLKQSSTSTMQLPDFDNTIEYVDEDPQIWPTKIRNGFCQYQGERETEYKTYKFKYVDKPSIDMLFVTDSGKYKFANNLIDDIWKKKLEEFKGSDNPEVSVLVDSFGFPTAQKYELNVTDGMNQSDFNKENNSGIGASYSRLEKYLIENPIEGNTYTEWKMDSKNSFIARIVTASNWLYDGKKYSFFQPITFSKKLADLNGIVLKKTRWVYAQNDEGRTDLQDGLASDGLCSYWWMRAKERKSQKLFTMLFGHDCPTTKSYYEKCMDEWRDCKQNNKDFWNGAIAGTGTFEEDAEKRFTLSSDLPWVKEFVISYRSSGLVLSGVLKAPDSCRLIVYDNEKNAVVSELNTVTATKYSELKDENAIAVGDSNIDVSFYYTDKTSFEQVAEVTLQFNHLTGVFCLRTRKYFCNI